ncbi:MAG: oxygenase MpaB family protein [Novosphingobium sp.]
MPSPAGLLRAGLVRRVRRVFNDEAAGEAPVARSSEALFGADAVIWRVHGNVAAMMAGGVAALLLQMLHPLALAGVLGHSDFRRDMLGRLRRTARFIAVTTYGHSRDAEAVIARVRMIHSSVKGKAGDGRAYSAEDPQLLAWIHVVEAVFFLAAHVRFVEPGMSRADQDAYFAEFATIARQLGADPVPTTLREASALLDLYRPELAAGGDTREVTRLILHGANTRRPASHALIADAAIGLLPVWARDMLELDLPAWRAAGAELGLNALAATLGWAFAGAPPSR